MKIMKAIFENRQRLSTFILLIISFAVYLATFTLLFNAAHMLSELSCAAAFIVASIPAAIVFFRRFKTKGTVLRATFIWLASLISCAVGFKILCFFTQIDIFSSVCFAFCLGLLFPFITKRFVLSGKLPCFSEFCFNALCLLIGLFCAYTFIYYSFSDFFTDIAEKQWLPMAIIAFAILLFAFFRFLLRIVSSKKLPSYALVLILVAIAVLPRLICIIALDTATKSDFNTYFKIGAAMAQGGMDSGKYVAVFPHVIGLPTFLAPLFKLFGAHLIVGQIFNLFLTACIVLLIYNIGSIFAGKSAGITACLIWAFFPSQIFYSVLLCSEYLYTALFLLSVFLFLRTFCKKEHTLPDTEKAKTAYTFIGAVLTGIFLALTDFVRPIAIILLIAFAIFFIVFIIKKKSKEKIVIKISAFLLLAAVYFTCGIGLNAFTEKAIGQPTVAGGYGWSLMVGTNAKSFGLWNEADSDFYNQLNGVQKLEPQQMQDIFLENAISRIKENGLQGNIKLLFQKHKWNWNTDHESVQYIKSALNGGGIGNRAFLKLYDFIYYFNTAFYLAIVLLVLFSFAYRIRYGTHKNLAVLMIAFCGIYCLHMLVEVAGRYHFTAVLLFCIFAAIGISKTKGNERKFIFTK